jgi:hypothetical protein
MLNDQIVAGIDLLVLKQDFADVVRVSLLPGQEMAQHLENVSDAIGVINVGVHDHFFGFAIDRESEL